MKRLAASAITLMMTAAIGTAAASPFDHDYRYEDGPYGRGYYDVARVVNAVPIYEYVNDQVSTRRCYDNDDGYSYNRGYRGYDGGYGYGYNGFDRYGYGSRYYDNSGVTGAKVLGALVGGALGHSVGKGDGRIATTAAGAAIGYAVAANIDAHGRYDRGCSNYDRDHGYWNNDGYGYGGDYCRYETGYRPERRIVGYDVTYDYHGRFGHVRSAFDPGRMIDVRVDVRPAM
jgi:uncharacterized protein YcfJ